MKEQPADLAIVGCSALVQGGSGLGFEDDVTIDVKKGRIAAIRRTRRKGDQEAERLLDGRGLYALPGFINTHTHVAMTPFRGAVEDVAVDAWFNDHVWPMEVNLEARDVWLGAMLGCAEMIESGVTTFADHYFFADQVAAAVETSGLRANLGLTFLANQGDAGLGRSIAFSEEWNGAAAGRITTSVAPHAPYTCDDRQLSLAAAAAEKLGVRIHIHAAEHLEQTEASVQERGMTPIQQLENAGVLTAGVLIAHGCGVVEDDLPLLEARRGKVAFAHCPKVYLKHGLAPLTPIRALLERGVAVGLGTDGAAGCNTLDIAESLRLMALTQKHAERDAEWMSLSTALRVAGPGSAAAVGLDGLIGALAPGYRADIVLVDLSGSHCQPLHDPAAAIVYSMRASDVRTTIVDGSVLMEDRKLSTVSTEEILDEVRERLPRLLDTAHGRRMARYPLARKAKPRRGG